MTQEETLQRLLAIAHEIKTQDNRITADPIWEIHDRRRIIGIEPQYTDNLVWLDSDGEVVSDPETLAMLGNPHGAACPKGYSKTGYHLQSEVVAVFFTDKAANEYLSQNKHRLDDEAYTFVGSLYRNEEMKFVRGLLGGGFLDLLATRESEELARLAELLAAAGIEPAALEAEVADAVRHRNSGRLSELAGEDEQENFIGNMAHHVATINNEGLLAQLIAIKEAYGLQYVHNLAKSRLTANKR